MDTADPGGEQSRFLVKEQLPFIEKQCCKACGIQTGQSAGFLDPDALFIEVLDRLGEDNYRIIREFRGQAKITTYITVIISNIVIDTFRKHQGRDRSRERAGKMGSVGERLHELVFGKGYAPEEAREALHLTFGHDITLEKVREMVATMQGRRQQHEALATEWGGLSLRPFVDEDGNIIVPDATSDPEQSLARRQRQQRSAGAIGDLLEGLSGEERLILMLRYPVDDRDEPKELASIAEILNCTEKAADGRIRRILSRCRELLLKKGVGLGDLVD